MMRTYEFDDTVLSPERFRFHVLRTLSTRKHRRQLIEKQKGKCTLCNHRLGKLAQVDHIIPVKEFAYNLAIPLTEAYLRCHESNNLRMVCAKCNNARNRKRKKPKPSKD
jgi:5-methylcytosine-specific restriction endonuclease McrA